MSKTFPQESSEAFFNLKKSALRRTKKLHQRVLSLWLMLSFYRTNVEPIDQAKAT